MNSKEHKKLQKAFKEFAKQVNETKESAQEFLISAGIHDKDGKLSKHYSEQN